MRYTAIIGYIGALGQLRKLWAYRRAAWARVMPISRIVNSERAIIKHWGGAA